MEGKERPPESAKGLDGSYNQTYLIRKARDAEDSHEVLFRCGNWCYTGLVQFHGLQLNTADLPVVIPTLQKQQGCLRYFCLAKSIPEDSAFHGPMRYMEEALHFLSNELASDSVEKELKKMSQIFPWIDADDTQTYFELVVADGPAFLADIALIASKTYTTRGLIIISIYFDGSLYCLLQSGEGDQPLLDVRFPDVSRHGQGVLLQTYHEYVTGFRKLTLWHIIDQDNSARLQRREMPRLKTANLASHNYEQTYVILRSQKDSKTGLLSVYHDVLFRFGTWCYSGRVQLTPQLSLCDVPFVIPALRMQQSRMDFFCDVTKVPVTSPHAPALLYMQRIAPLVEEHIAEAESSLRALLDRLSSMGLGESVGKWLEGDPSNSFFEFKLAEDVQTQERMKSVEMVVSKIYHASGIVTIAIVFQSAVYVSLQETTDDNPLLDSRFPDVSGKGRGYQLQAYSTGTDSWPELRKISIWQTLNALEQEFREKAAEFAALRKTDSKADDKHETEGKTDAPQGKGDEEAAMDEEEEELVFVPRQDFKIVEDEKHAEEANRVGAGSDRLVSAAAAAKEGHVDGGGERVKQALPHHIPKMQMLSTKLDSIRKNLGEEGLKAPWDLKGRPLGSIGGK